jgi:hypothetical protein
VFVLSVAPDISIPPTKTAFAYLVGVESMNHFAAAKTNLWLVAFGERKGLDIENTSLLLLTGGRGVRFYALKPKAF